MPAGQALDRRIISGFALASRTFLGQNGRALTGLESRTFVACVVLATALLTGAHARQTSAAPAPAPQPLVPAAASSIAAHPDAFYGLNVSVTAAVDRILSPTSFTIDQDATRPAAADVVILAEFLIEPVTVNTYVTVIGEVVARDGRPAIRATSVINAAMVDLAKRPVPPMTADEAAFDKVMKRIGPAFAALREAVAAAEGAAPETHATTLTQGFAEAEAFWKKRHKADAAQWAAEARTQAATLGRAGAAARWDEAKTALTDLQQTCAACHGAYRQRLDDGSYRIK